MIVTFFFQYIPRKWKLVTDPFLKQGVHKLSNYMKETPKLKIFNLIKNQKNSLYKENSLLSSEVQSQRIKVKRLRDWFS